VIRESIFEGRFAPGTPLPESALSAALRVSRNTVREAFRTLIGEHLLAHEPHKGVVVRRLTSADVRDIFHLRRMLELGALDLVAEAGGRVDVAAIDRTLTAADAAAQAGQWVEVGTADLRFHAEIVRVHGSVRIDEIFHRLMTEVRLGFLAGADPAALHGEFLARNREIRDLLADGRIGEALKRLAGYLDDAEERVILDVAGGDE
jgi:DNA-binding GntR family transcriptional regulator